MNKQILELAEQAGLYDEKTPEEVPGFTACFEKFAELLVKECGAVQHRRFCEHGDVSWDILMQHFGIKE